MTEAVVAKMQCQAVETREYSPTYVQKKVELSAIYGTAGENAAFTKATPSGACWMNIDPDAPAAAFFKPGKQYYVTFTEVPEAPR
jgi:hypothetical protein